MSEATAAAVAPRGCAGTIQVVAVDIGGTHARFALAELRTGQRPALGLMRKYRTADHAGFASAWAAFARDCGGVLPAAASIAIAGPVDGELIRFTNNPWIIRPATIGAELRLDNAPLLLNDFAAMAAGIGVMDDSEFYHLGGPAGAWPSSGVTTVIGPGTGLGVAQLLRSGGRNIVIATEGGHIDFPALDSFEEALLRHLRAQHGRVSIERVASGPALAGIRETLATISGQAIMPMNDAALWQAAIDGSDILATQALDRLAMTLGSITGDLALAHGANAVVVTGGIANRIRDRLSGPLFNERFRAKGRFARRMNDLPIRLSVHPEPGLLGAAAAYQEQRC